MLETTLMLGLSLLFACHHGLPSPPTQPIQPHIEAVRPDSVVVARGAVVEAVVVGRGFTPGRLGRNSIEFAGVTLSNIAANDAGTEIRFVIPDALPSGGEAPPMSLHSGPYTVRVTTAAGISNTVTIRVYR